MGIIQAGILSPVSGKVAGVVGGRWKNKAYIRAYTIPANPNTAAQQVQRTKFSDCVNFAKVLVGQVFNSFTDAFQKTMSGYNFFIKRNIAVFDGTPDYAAIKMTEGPLSAPTNDTALYEATTMTIDFLANNGNDGEDGDSVFAVVYDKSTELFYFASAVVDRSVEQIIVAMPAGLTATNLQTWIFAAQYVSGVLKKISNSSFKVGEA